MKEKNKTTTERGLSGAIRPRRGTRFFLALLLILFAPPLPSCGGSKTDHRLVIIAVDGMDYKLTRRWIDEGAMPNFAALEQEGGFKPLGTSIPPESPVAWSNFITGQNPGGHGIFDFIHHKWDYDPGTGRCRLLPVDPVAETEPVGLSLPLFGYDFPITGGDQINKRKGAAFWELLEKEDIPATLFKVVADFPPTETGQKTMSGMGTPDLKGGYGTYFIYTDNQFALPGRVQRGELVTNTVYDNVFHDYLYGPVNPLVKKGEKPEVSKVPFWVYLDPDKPMAKIAIGADEDSATCLVLEQGEWSDFVEVKFEIIPELMNVWGIVRFNLQEVRPDFRLFADPINIDPLSPASDITTPPGWSAEVARKYGLFATKGMPENTAALKDGILSYDEYRAHSRKIYNKRKELFFDLLKEQDSGVLFHYFCSVDLDCHMFWSLTDEKHPYYDPNASKTNKNFIKWLYTDLDAFLGRVRSKLRPDDTLIVMSDHGFAPLYRTFNLNSWLLDKGYLKLKNGKGRKDCEGLDFSAVDWAHTRAYSIGFASIYLNVKGRDPLGVVLPGESDELVDEICSRLMLEKDPKTGGPVFLKMYKTRDVYTGNAAPTAPEIIAGFKAGYGASDESALGEFTKEIIKDNMSAWSGSHLMAAEEVPGVLLSNKRISLENPKLYDLTVSILDEFGVQKAATMIGRSVW